MKKLRKKGLCPNFNLCLSSHSLKKIFCVLNQETNTEEREQQTDSCL